MYPELFTIPGTSYTISTFGVMMAAGFLVGYWITARRMVEEGLDPEPAQNILVWIMLGGIGGSKLYFAIDVSLREGLPFFDLLFDRAGITWYGSTCSRTVSPSGSRSARPSVASAVFSSATTTAAYRTCPGR